MKPLHRNAVTATLVLGTVALGPCASFAKDYPIKTVRIIAGAVGGGGDLIARLVAAGIQGPLGQPVIVENRNGAIL